MELSQTCFKFYLSEMILKMGQVKFTDVTAQVAPDLNNIGLGL